MSDYRRPRLVLQAPRPTRPIASHAACRPGGTDRAAAGEEERRCSGAVGRESLAPRALLDRACSPVSWTEGG